MKRRPRVVGTQVAAWLRYADEHGVDQSIAIRSKQVARYINEQRVQLEAAETALRRQAETITRMREELKALRASTLVRWLEKRIARRVVAPSAEGGNA